MLEDMTMEEFGRLRDIVYRRAGIHFDPIKFYFVSKRVEKRVRALRLDSFAEYLRYLKFSDRDRSEFQNLINHLTVNETYFFREFPQLQAFAENCLLEVVERKAARDDNTIRVWSAGCSTGEEPYTLSIILREMLLDIGDWKIEILASDIDERVLECARRGIYDRRSVKEVPEDYLNEYFTRHGDKFIVNTRVKENVLFEHINLSKFSPIQKHRDFDFIFCRNVLIYFNDISRRKVVNNFYTSLKTGGYIFLSTTESMGRITTAFKLKRMGKHLVYTKE